MTLLTKLRSLAAIGRAVDGVAVLSSAANPTRHRFLQPAPYTTIISSSSTLHQAFSRDWLAAPYGAVGVKCFSVASTAASSFAEDVNARDLRRSESYLPKEVVLYQYEACPFCNKVKAFLDYYSFQYKIVEVNPISKREIKWSDYKKVPILMVDGEQMVDSSEIVDKLFQRVHPSLNVDSVSNADEVRHWRGWVDNHLVHILSPNIYRTPSEALESFDYITTHGKFSYFERLVGKYSGAAAMYFVSKKLKKKHNITDERQALYDAAETWVNALKGRPFLGLFKFSGFSKVLFFILFSSFLGFASTYIILIGGTNPNLADLAVYGVLRPICQLKSGKDMVEHTRIGEWFARMESEMEQKRQRVRVE